jgi:hypothetical protein
LDMGPGGPASAGCGHHHPCGLAAEG